MTVSLPILMELAWANAAPGREAAERNKMLRASQPCPLSGKPDIEPTPPNDRVLTQCCRRRSSLLALRYSYSINSSALSRIDVGTSRPSALAVVILSTVSYFTDTCKADRPASHS